MPPCRWLPFELVNPQDYTQYSSFRPEISDNFNASILMWFNPGSESTTIGNAFCSASLQCLKVVAEESFTNGLQYLWL
jgi:hypothetical protein